MTTQHRIPLIALGLLCALLFTVNNQVGAAKLAPTVTARASKTPKPTATPKGGAAPAGKIVYLDYDSGSLFISNTDGTDLHTLLGNIHVLDFTWSADGKEIAFTSQDEDKNPKQNISILDMSTGSIRTLSTNGIYPEWLTLSPDSQAIAFAQDDADFDSNYQVDIYSLDLQTGTLTRLFNAVLKASKVREDGNENRSYFNGLNWSPDGKRFLYSMTPTDFGRELHLIDSNGKNDRMIYKVTNPNPDWSAVPQWSLDGKKILIGIHNPNGVMVMDLASGAQKKINLGFSANFIYCCGGADAYTWSPDGKYIVALNGGNFGDSVITTIASDGRNRRDYVTGAAWGRTRRVVWHMTAPTLSAPVLATSS